MRERRRSPPRRRERVNNLHCKLDQRPPGPEKNSPLALESQCFTLFRENIELQIQEKKKHLLPVATRLCLLKISEVFRSTYSI